MGSKSKAGRRRSSSPFPRGVCRDTHARRFRTAAPSRGGGVGGQECVHALGAKQLPGEGDCGRGGERATIGTRCPQKLMT